MDGLYLASALAEELVKRGIQQGHHNELDNYKGKYAVKTARNAAREPLRYFVDADLAPTTVVKDTEP